MRLTGSAASIVSGLARGVLLTAATIGPAGADRVAPQAGEQWHYRAQVDGRGGMDRITITAQPGFTSGYGVALGQVLVRVDFDGGAFAEARQDLSYASVRKPWTPWLGATDLDRRGGKEVVLGYTTGAHSQGFIAYSYRPDGELLPLRDPTRSSSWFINSSYGTGTSGWRCTRRGVQQRAVSASGHRNAEVRLTSYTMGGDGEWRRTKRVVRTVKVDSFGNPPAHTAKYPRFACAGLPKNVL